jgi:DNA mismatch repair protein MutL
VHAAKEEVGHAVTSELWKFILTDFKSAMSSNYSEYIQTRAFTKNGGGDIESHSEGIEVLGIMHDNFIIARENQELLIVDAHAASERITLERIRQGRLETNNIPSVTLQVPENTEVIAEKLRSFGFVADDMGDGYIVISATPYGIPITPSSGKQILKALREGEDAVLPIIAKIACHISFRTGDGMTDNRALELLEAMKTVENFQVCPHGRPTIFRISRKSLEKMFGRG